MRNFGLTLVVLLAGGAIHVNASSIYAATLSGANEVPQNPSTATGSATLTLNGDSLTANIVFSGLTAPATASHIHCCVPPGTSTGVALPFSNFPATTSGSYTNTFDLTLIGTYNSTFVTNNGGTAAGAEAALIAGLNAGQSYVNIHDANFTGGEIEGFAAAVPEPGTFLLLGLGLIAIPIRRRVGRMSWS